MNRYLHLTVRLGLLLFILVLIIPETTVAQATGKIAGVITDVANGEPIPGVNVFIEGTNFGAESDLEGTYVILNVPAVNY